MAVDWDVIGWIGKGGGGRRAVKQPSVGFTIKGAAAADLVRPQKPNVARGRHRRTACEIEFVGLFRVSGVVQRLDAIIDLR